MSERIAATVQTKRVKTATSGGYFVSRLREAVRRVKRGSPSNIKGRAASKFEADANDMASGGTEFRYRRSGPPSKHTHTWLHTAAVKRPKLQGSLKFE